MTEKLNRGYCYRYQVDREGQNALELLCSRFPHSTMDTWQQRFENDEIRLNGAPATADSTLHQGDHLEWFRPPWVEDKVPSDYEVLWKDEHLLAVYKPSGLPTMPGGGFLENTLWHFVASHQIDANHPRPIPLHRLGRATSGIVLFALNKKTAGVLNSNWPSIHKTYLALASGCARQSEIEITTPIGTTDKHPRLQNVFVAEPTGKPSCSVARVLEIDNELATTLFEVDLVTGRPHQIRIHLASIGHPLVGDPLYACGGGLVHEPALPGDGGYWLHAWRMQFNHPATGSAITLVADPPDKLQRRL